MSSSSKPAWVKTYAQVNIYDKPTITVETSDINL